MPTTDTYSDALRWDNVGSSRLLLIFPGASGIGAAPGYKSLASWFWLHAYNVLLCPPPGSDGIEGKVGRGVESTERRMAERGFEGSRNAICTTAICCDQTNK